MKKIILLLLLSFLSCAKKDRINHYLPKPVTPKELMHNGFYRYNYKMKIILLLLISLLLFNSCQKIDRINHYTNELVTQKELADNGFYKYSMTGLEGIVNEKHTLKDGDPVVPSKFTKFIMVVYTNIAPTNNDKRPIPVFKDSNAIKGKIITYFFKNDILEFKSIISPIDNNNQQKGLFKTKKDIEQYYKELKIPIKEIPLEKLRNHNDSIGLRSRFIINNYESYFYLSDRNEMTTYYIKDKKGNEDMLVWDFYNENSPYKYVE